MVVDVKLQVGRWPLYLSVWDAAKIAPPTDQPNDSTSARVQSSRWFWAKHPRGFFLYSRAATKALTSHCSHNISRRPVIGVRMRWTNEQWIEEFGTYLGWGFKVRIINQKLFVPTRWQTGQQAQMISKSTPSSTRVVKEDSFKLEMERRAWPSLRSFFIIFLCS